MIVTKSDVKVLDNKLEKVMKLIEQHFQKQQQEQEHHNNHLNKEITALKELFSHQQDNSEDILSQLKAALAQVKYHNERYERLLNTFAMLEKDTQKRLFEHASSEMNLALDKFRHSARQYQQVEEHMLELKSKIAVIETQIDKFMDIAKTIKEKDFTLSTHFKNMKAQDGEKLQLLRENERLKQLIAKERRRTR